MTRAKIENLDDVKAWIAEHDGRYEVASENQATWNTKTDKAFADMAQEIVDVAKTQALTNQTLQSQTRAINSLSEAVKGLQKANVEAKADKSFVQGGAATLALVATAVASIAGLAAQFLR